MAETGVIYSIDPIIYRSRWHNVYILIQVLSTFFILSKRRIFNPVYIAYLCNRQSFIALNIYIFVKFNYYLVLSGLINYDLSDRLVIIYSIYEISENINDPIRKSKPLHLDSCINRFVCAVSLIPVRLTCSLQNPSKSMSKFLDIMYKAKAYYESFPIRKILIKT